MPSPDAVRAAIVELLGTGARPRDEIVDALREADRSDRSIDERVARLLQRDTTFSEVADGVVYVPALLEGTTWTVHVDAADAAEGFVRSHLHLAPLSWWLIEGGVELVSADGDVLGDLSTDDRWIDDRNIDVVYGPPHWLDAVAGGWASVTVAGGAIRLAPLDAPPGPTRRQIDALRQGFERDLRSWSDDEEDGRPTGYAVGDGSVYEAVLIDRDAFVDSPVPALPDLYGAAGLEQRNGIIAPIGFDWDVLHAWQRRNMTKRMYGLDDEQADVLAALVGACDEFASEGPDALGSSEVERDSSAVLLSGLLDDGDVAAAFLEETERRGVAVEDVGRFADHLAERTDGSPASGVAWARARVREILGDSRGALALLEAAVGASCTHRPALLSLAGYASDRGDAPTAHRLLDRAGALDVEADDQEHEHDEACRLLDEVAPYALNRPRATAGRNEPCPCGSGRKYKACHLGREMHPLADRAKWLYDKAMRYARTNDHDTLREVADDLLSGDPWHVDELAESPFVGDLVLHHFDTFADFLEERSWLLPDDEAMLAAQWALVDSSVFEVVDIHHERVDVHDLRTGDDLTVVNLTLDREVRRGSVLFGRPLPVGDSHRAFGGFLPLPHQSLRPMLDALDSGDPDRIVEVIADVFRPPSLRNTDGHEMVLHTLTWSVDAQTDVAAALARAGLTTEDGTSWTLTGVAGGRPDTLLASLSLDQAGGRLVGEVNSDERAARLIELIGQHLPDSSLIDDHERFLDEFDTERPAPVSMSDDPEIRRALEEHMAEMERHWLDESIPALGGRTPRESVLDPIGREEVRSLLASLPEPAGEMMAMSPARLAALLDLDL